MCRSNVSTIETTAYNNNLEPCAYETLQQTHPAHIYLLKYNKNRCKRIGTVEGTYLSLSLHQVRFCRLSYRKTHQEQRQMV